MILLAEGVAAYRSGRYDVARGRLRQFLNSNLNPAVTTGARLYLALAEHRAGNAEQARRLFDEAGETFGEVQISRDWGGYWTAWLIVDLTFREAEQLIEGDAG
jgi:hypothetical protein